MDRNQIFDIAAGPDRRSALAHHRQHVRVLRWLQRVPLRHRAEDQRELVDRRQGRHRSDHTASEAAHDYRIVGEGWRGTQTFAYPPLKEDWTVQ
ncbi:hypothetical protein [Nonomuraea dietziae]|uniref:hypothetical protein n=1 Tax=Nonomuraea dietziae TaxID=65515 RepID=UPI0031D8032F